MLIHSDLHQHQICCPVLCWSFWKSVHRVSSVCQKTKQKNKTKLQLKRFFCFSSSVSDRQTECRRREGNVVLNYGCPALNFSVRSIAKRAFYHHLEARFTRAQTLNQTVGVKTKTISGKMLKCAAELRGTAQPGYIFLWFYHHCSSFLNYQQWFNTFLIFNHD